MDEVAAVNALATGGLRPDLTILLELDHDAAFARAGEEDRFEAEGAELQRRVADGLLRSWPPPSPSAGGASTPNRPPDEVHADVLAAVRAARAGAPA